VHDWPQDSIGQAIPYGIYEVMHIFIDFGQLCSSKPATNVHGNRTAVFMISASRFHSGQHTWKAS
jgi:hypothetical protein